MCKSKIYSSKSKIIKKRGRPAKNNKILKNKSIHIDKNIIIRKRGRPRKNFTVKDKYNNPKKSFENNQNKNFINAMFASEIIKLKLSNKEKSEEYFICALDSIEHNTSNTLISLGIDKNSILLVESDNSIASLHSKDGFITFNGTLEDFSSNIHDKLFSKKNSAWRKYTCLGWYFDTCGTIRLQKKGIIDTIKKTKFIDGSILTFTFCRTRVLKKKYELDKKNFIKELQKLFSNIGFKIDIILDHDYSGNCVFIRSREGMHMNTIMCRIYKDM
jgi:hypothetical protein